MNHNVTKVLIANRGEIAARIARGARAEGIRSVGVYADSDFNAGFLELVDEAYALDGETPAETYLDAEKLIAIARRSGANAIHPGYGFLSENADFARRVAAEGLIWIGPSGEVIDRLGDKVSARAAAAAADAPLLPSTDGYVESAEQVAAFGAEHGYPIAIKAVFGGGGRGLRVVRSENEVESQLRSARDEARTAFGREECFVEVFLDRPRHVETQVIADEHGNVVVVGTRDCSLQRRNQKVIEEAPAPYLDAGIRADLVEGSRRIFREVGYVGAGTVEFLVSPDGRSTFLEVNTRLQVEHPVSEEAFGIDLVREQFRIARGERLSLDADPEPIGHAIEFRINAEDPLSGFLPSQGRVTAWIAPEGEGVRLDTDAGSGTQISGTFDSLLAKLIVTGRTREEALERARRALAEYHVHGIATLIPFHRSIVETPAFTGYEGGFEVYTQWIENEWTPEGVVADSGEIASPAPLALDTFVIEVDGRRATVRANPGAFAVEAAEAVPQRPRAKRRRAVAGNTDSGVFVAPMRGEVTRVDVVPGDAVGVGDVLLVIEAMKMELPIRATAASTVREVKVAAGQPVTSGDLLVLLEGDG
ncbi:MAG: ATP-grasp domain-containing protein [Herbiconiux sp.]|uniref:acetyl/propionyl/methylcrotonyl-CoA carboxylase subunit alpha n=1 Tax=Herbiconiux sp. TaxID=1871186 RepID=UPI00121971FF|nr:biotin carboxylase N-terminal domain-containing protein [Herbiconiux sp.]TAJ46910.1 MAG: ATP-grasp domain-containing protein [Herbiconiux sp.]